MRIEGFFLFCAAGVEGRKVVEDSTEAVAVVVQEQDDKRRER